MRAATVPAGRAAIVGGGVIGGGWAARFVLNGWDVDVFDPAPDAARRVDEVLANARRALPMLYERSLPRAGRLRHVATLEAAVNGADWVQESVPERLELKLATRDAIEAAVAGDVPIASSTSGFRPSQLAEGALASGRIVVAHPFNPVYLLPLVELVGGDEGTAERAATLLRGIGMHPLRLARENDAHVADRLLEAVWREALWLVCDGYASTAEVDDAIRYGFGLRWAQMGLFETYRIAGGEGGMAHFVEQFGPCLAWPWTKLTDVPELTAELVDTVAAQSDAQSGQRSVRELERLRDDNLVAILRALKGQGAAAGALIAAHETTLPAPGEQPPSVNGGAASSTGPSDTAAATPPGAPDRVDGASDRRSGETSDERASARFLVTVHRTVPVDWTDYNGHMNESRYGQVFSDAADAVLAHVGCGPAYVANGLSWFTAESTIRYLDETRAGETIVVLTRVVLAEGKKLRLVHDMRRAADDGVLASGEQFLLHVSLDTRRSRDPAPAVCERLARLAQAHREVPS